MKVLILGANGMLGHDLIAVFNAAGYETIGADKPEIDIADKARIKDYIEQAKPDFVINAAAYTAVDDCEKNAELANLVNGTAVGFIAEACKEINATLVHISTDYIFDGHAAEGCTAAGGYKEDDSPNPINAYGKSKLLGEQELARIMGDGGKYYLVRTSWLYGKHGKNFVDTIISLGCSRPWLNVVNDQIGKPTYTADLAAAIKDLILSAPANGIYHLVNENAVSWYDFTLEIFGLLNIKTPVKPVSSSEFPRPAERPKCSILINNKRPHLRDHFDALKDCVRLLAVRAQ
ncbi:dTDP-4-dehydrorhamnose reductase [Candidatus Peregrinibacteria bacterium]|nr:dTDP-4-dehydrorhamnose reductase [Candidatus Peregrinibacteria bacterium]